ncbi:MAG: Type 1 glutamine amidotransferase-like domain-containing protein [Deltaproteobacteria bacterium]|nr:Type 1 glutamine amidotransferase-like domain-containing protein [Deltaproteobacteria bacterium]
MTQMSFLTNEPIGRRESLSGLLSIGLSLFTFSSRSEAERPTQVQDVYTKISDDKRLLLCGGGQRPEAALADFVERARKSAELRADLSTSKSRDHIGAVSTNILVIGWAKSDPARFYPAFKEQIAKYENCRTTLAPSRDETIKSESKREGFIQDIRKADGIFFLGGDQAGIMRVIDSHEAIRNELISFFNSGRATGGTSAGTAIMSNPMINGYRPLNSFAQVRLSESHSDVRICHGLGLCPKGVVVDQHGFSENLPGRSERMHLVTVATKSPVGIVVGEDGAAALTIEAKGSVTLSVLGGEIGLSLKRADGNGYQRTLLKSGEVLRLERYLQSSESALAEAR